MLSKTVLHLKDLITAVKNGDLKPDKPKYKEDMQNDVLDFAIDFGNGLIVYTNGSGEAFVQIGDKLPTLRIGKADNSDGYSITGCRKLLKFDGFQCVLGN